MGGSDPPCWHCVQGDKVMENEQHCRKKKWVFGSDKIKIKEGMSH